MAPAKKDQNQPVSAQAQQEAVVDGIENYELPKALVTRIAKSTIPENAKLQKDVVNALVKGSTVFINYLAATAHDIATSRQHKSVSASDVLKALELVQFGHMVAPLTEELKAYRELVKNAKKGKDSNTKSKSKGKERASNMVVAAPEGSVQEEARGTDSDGDALEDEENQQDELDDDDDEVEAGGDNEDQLVDDEGDEDVDEEESELIENQMEIDDQEEGRRQDENT